MTCCGPSAITDIFTAVDASPASRQQLDECLAPFAPGAIGNLTLSNALLAGLAGPITRELRLPLVCLLQDEDGFIDGLGELYSSKAWSELTRCCRDIRAFIARTRDYADLMTRRLGLPPQAVHVVSLGVEGADLPLAAAAMSNIFQLATMETAT